MGDCANVLPRAVNYAKEPQMDILTFSELMTGILSLLGTGMLQQLELQRDGMA